MSNDGVAVFFEPVLEARLEPDVGVATFRGDAPVSLPEGTTIDPSPAIVPGLPGPPGPPGPPGSEGPPGSIPDLATLTLDGGFF